MSAEERAAAYARIREAYARSSEAARIASARWAAVSPAIKQALCPDELGARQVHPVTTTGNERTVCVLCGRIGSRGFVILSGNGDGTRDSYCCVNERACARRQRSSSLPTS